MSQPPDSQPRAIQIESGGRAWALLIGVDDYVDATDLKYAGRDMNGLRQRLIASGFEEDHVITLSSQTGEARLWPFKSNIEHQLDLLLGKLDAEGKTTVKAGLVRPGDVVLLAFSGHGVHSTEKDESYLCPADTRLSDPATLVSLQKVYRRLQSSEANLKLMIIDACRNDPRPEGSRDPGTDAGTDQFARDLLNHPRGILMMSSCKAGEVSWEDGTFRHGVFMNFVLSGLDGAADNKSENPSADEDGHVSLLELFQFAASKTTAYVGKHFQKEQTPVLKADEFNVRFGAYTGRLPVTAFFSVREENAEGPPLTDAKIALTYRPDSQATPEFLAHATTDENGSARLTVYLTKDQRSHGDFLASISKGEVRKDSSLPGFLETRSWNLYVPSPSPLAVRARELVAAAKYAEAADLIWSKWSVADASVKELFVDAASRVPDWWISQGRKSIDALSDSSPAELTQVQLALAGSASRRGDQALFASAFMAALNATKRIRDPMEAAESLYFVASVAAELNQKDSVARACRSTKLALDGVPRDSSGNPTRGQWNRYMLLCRIAGLCHRVGLTTDANSYLEQAYSLISTDGSARDFYYDFTMHSLIMTLCEAGDLKSINQLEFAANGEVRLSYLSGSRKVRVLGDSRAFRLGTDPDSRSAQDRGSRYETQCHASLALAAARGGQEERYLTHRRRAEAVLSNTYGKPGWENGDDSREECYQWLIQAEAAMGAADDASDWLGRLQLKNRAYHEEALFSIATACSRKGLMSRSRELLSRELDQPNRLLATWDISQRTSKQDLLAHAEWLQKLRASSEQACVAFLGTGLAFQSGNAVAAIAAPANAAPRGIAPPQFQISNASQTSELYVREPGASQDEWQQVKPGKTIDWNGRPQVEYYDGRSWTRLHLGRLTFRVNDDRQWTVAPTP